MRTVFLLALMGLVLGLLNGCCTPKVIIKTVEVQVPVAVRCKVKWPEQPAVTVVKTEPRGPGLYYKGQVVLNELEEQRRFANELNVALKQCADPE